MTPTTQLKTTEASTMAHNTELRMPRWIYPTAGFVLVAVTLSVAREVLMPVALAVLAAFLLAPLVRWLEHIKLPRALAILIALGLSTAGVGVIAWAVQSELVGLAKELPSYRTNILTKIDSIRLLPDSTLGRAKQTIEELGRHMAEPASTLNPADATFAPVDAKKEASANSEPIPVTVVETPASPMSYGASFLARILPPLVTTSIVIVFSVFILFKREDLRNRLIRLIGERDMHVTTPALDEAARRVSRYLLMQVLTNTCTAILVAIGLLIVGVPNAAMWGVIIGLLRFVPYIGVLTGALTLGATTLAVSDGWLQPVAALGVVAAIELLMANVLEPLFLSSGTGLSPLAVLASAVFWGWLWGPVGLVVATPLTVCVAVVGRHVPRLAFLEILLGDEPALSPEAHLCQRLLAGDQDESARVVESFGSDKTLAQVFDSLLLPCLRMIEISRHRGDLDSERSHLAFEMLGTLIDDAADRYAPQAHAASTPFDGPRPRALCLPARDKADELGARMVEKLVIQAGGDVLALSSDELVGELLERIAGTSPIAVCVSALPPAASLHARVLCKRIRTRFPDIKLVVGIWDASIDPQTMKSTLNINTSDTVVNELALCATLLKGLTSQHALPQVSASA